MMKSGFGDSLTALLGSPPPRGSVATAIAAPGWSPAAHLQATQPALASGEARVLRLCAEIEAIERRIDALHAEHRTLEDEGSLDEALAPLNRALRVKLDRLCGTMCDTPAAIQARLRLLATVAPEWADEADAGRCIPSRILAAILRDAGGSVVR